MDGPFGPLRSRSAHCAVCAYAGDSASAEPWRLVPGFAMGSALSRSIGWGLVPGSARFPLCCYLGYVRRSLPKKAADGNGAAARLAFAA